MCSQDIFSLLGTSQDISSKKIIIGAFNLAFQNVCHIFQTVQ
jgi:hypothetical protein